MANGASSRAARGHGISKSHPDDSGIEKHSAVLLAESFEGFGWRTVPELAVSYFMLSHYVTENACRHNNIANPPKTNRVWFDDIELATEYIGPILAR